MASEEKSLKTQNAAWLWSVAVLDCVILLGIQFAGASDTLELSETAKQIGIRGALSSAAPVLVLLLTNLFSADFKAALIYWRFRDVLPSHRAFSIHAEHDSRIDPAALKRHVGAWPDQPKAQSAFWYKLYKAVDTDVSVSTAHRHYLLFRDLAAMSVFLVFVAPLVASLFVRALAAPSAMLFLVQYVAAAVSARHQGTRMVTTVLALHSIKKRR